MLWHRKYFRIITSCKEPLFNIEVMYFIIAKYLETIFARRFFFSNFSYAINIHDMSEAFIVEKSKGKVRLRMSY